MATAEEGCFPSVDEVLNELKSNGTFDQFRKTCLASVEAEPSFRAYGEHVEVVARRYLQNFKWRDNTTKNQVRSRLKDHALSIIESPDIQVGVPFSSLVEKAMESKGKELLPKIMEVVNTLRQAKPIPAQLSETAASTKDEAKEENNSYKPGLEFDLTLPIDLPGLVSRGYKKDSAISVESVTKSVKSKQKHIDSSVKGGSMKAKAQVNDSKPFTESVKDTKSKEKDKDGSQKLLSGEGKKELKTKSVKPKKVKEEVEDRESQDKQKDITAATVEGTSETEKSTEGLTDRKDKRGDGASDKMEKRSEKVSERKEKNIEGTNERKSVGKAKETKCENSIGSSTSSANSISRSARNDDDTKNEPEKKQLPPRRRSVRLASLTEEQKKDGPSDTELEDETRKQQISDDEFEVRTFRTHGNRKRKAHRTTTSRQKRSRVYLDPSSEESGDERYSTRRATPDASEEERPDTRRSGHKKRAYKPNPDIAKESRAKTQSRTVSPASTGSSTSSALMTEGQGVHHKVLEQTKTHIRKTKCPQRLPNSPRGSSKSPIKSPPPPVVITRSNRHVKPNRRYYDDNMSDEEETDREHSGQSDDEVSGTYTTHYTNLKKVLR